jgi:phage terminase large subunit-like protein
MTAAPPLRPPIRRIGDLLDLPAGRRASILSEMNADECAQIFYDWNLWARPDQAPPPGDWVVWLILAGRGAGKTRSGAEAVRRWAKDFPFVNLIGPTADDVRDVMVLGESGILGICRRDERPRYLPSAARLEWPNGAVSLLFSAEEPDRLRGKQHMKLWLDELAAWRQPDAFDQAMLGLRLGDRPQMVVTTTPRPTKIIRRLTADKDTIVTRGSTFDNRGHLARAFLDRIAKRYEGRVIGRQELFAEIVEETPGALWTRALLERQRIAPEDAPDDLPEVVVAVDPPARPGAKADSCGIVVAGRAGGKFYVLADLTSQGDTPAGWAARVGAAYRGFGATGSWPRLTWAARWSRKCCGRPSRTCRCAPSPRRAANISAPSRSPRPTSAVWCCMRGSSPSWKTSSARSSPASTAVCPVLRIGPTRWSGR